MCDRAVELTGKDTVYCPDCKYIPLLDSANEEAVDLIQAISFGLFDGMGGINFQAVEYGFRLLDIPKERHRALLEKIAVYVRVVREHQETHRDDPEKTPVTMAMRR